MRCSGAIILVLVTAVAAYPIETRDPGWKEKLKSAVASPTAEKASIACQAGGMVLSACLAYAGVPGPKAAIPAAVGQLPGYAVKYAQVKEKETPLLPTVEPHHELAHLDHAAPPASGAAIHPPPTAHSPAVAPPPQHPSEAHPLDEHKPLPALPVAIPSTHGSSSRPAHH